MGGSVGGEGADQRDHHEPVAVEVRRCDDRAEQDDHDRDERDEDRAEPHDLLHHRLTALIDGPAMRERPAELLLEREEEAGSQREHGEPHRRDRSELLRAADSDRADLEERVGGEPGDQQRDADGDGALG